MDFICFRDRINIIFLCLSLFWNCFTQYFLETLSMCTPSSPHQQDISTGVTGMQGEEGPIPTHLLTPTHTKTGCGWARWIVPKQQDSSHQTSTKWVWRDYVQHAKHTHLSLERPRLASGVVCQIPFEILGSREQWEKTTHSRVHV